MSMAKGVHSQKIVTENASTTLGKIKFEPPLLADCSRFQEKGPLPVGVHPKNAIPCMVTSPNKQG